LNVLMIEEGDCAVTPLPPRSRKEIRHPQVDPGLLGLPVTIFALK
jgi:hypothetical protein